MAKAKEGLGMIHFNEKCQAYQLVCQTRKFWLAETCPLIALGLSLDPAPNQPVAWHQNNESFH